MASTATVGINVVISDPDTGLTVQGIGSYLASLPAGVAVTDMILTADTEKQALPFPNGVSTAAVAFVKAVGGSGGCTDLTVQVATAAGSTVLTVPVNAAQVFYGVSALYVSSVLGGKIQYSVGG